MNEEAVRSEFKIEVRETRVDKKAIAEYIKETGEIPDGIDAKQNEHLRIN